MKFRNPFGFTPGPVTFWTVFIYTAFIIPLVYIHETVPPPPKSPDPSPGLNLTEAWHDLTQITRHYHPYNSRANEQVGDYIVQRIEEILGRNGVDWTKEHSGGVQWPVTAYRDLRPEPPTTRAPTVRRSSGPAATVFIDDISNVTWATSVGMLGDRITGSGTYFEGTNKVVYVRGTEDEDGEWWKSDMTEMRVLGRGGVLVNAHYDSVSSGYGATDDGMGCVSLLQMLSYFTTPGQQPKRGIVFLFNNAEEDGLLGAKAFAYSPLLSFPTTFVNLEGAGAGGRAMLFRASDMEVTASYRNARHPFGSIIASDGFSLGLIRSQTDYVVWEGIYGQRGLDIAFYRPRARYHTNQDDTRHTSRGSLWHMLSGSLAAVESLSHDTSGTFSGPRPDGDRLKVPSGSPSNGVWFDVFGKGFAVFALRGLFAWSLTLLIVSPLVLVMITYLLAKKDKYYFFARKVVTQGRDLDEPVTLGGLKGFLRFPLALVVSTGLTLASGFLVKKVNPMIVYSSEYAVWVMMLSLFYVTFWTVMKGSSVVRPSALQRGFVHIWLFSLGWAMLVAVAVFSDRFRIGSGYPIAFLNSALFLSTLVAMLELFALPSKQEFAQSLHDGRQAGDDTHDDSNTDALIAPTPGEIEHTYPSRVGSDEEDEEPTERTPLRSAESRADQVSRTTFGQAYRRSISAVSDTSDDGERCPEPFEGEQSWSGRLPTWTWFLQLLILAPVTILFFGQIGLVLVSSIQASGADGGDVLVAYLAIAIFSVLILLPLSPFSHRVTFHVPSALFAVFVAALIYNLVAFPFSANNRYKVYFQQDLFLDNGTSEVQITGIEHYTRMIINELPSAAGKPLTCEDSPGRPGLSNCRYNGSSVLPNLTGRLREGESASGDRYEGLVSLDITRPGSGINKASFRIDANESKVCKLSFEKPVSVFDVRGGAGLDSRFGEYPDEGVSVLQLFRRDWSGAWIVDVEWEDKTTQSGEQDGSDIGPAKDDDRGTELRKRSTLEGKVECQWSDANVPGTIPAYDECLQYSPSWAAFSKYSVGLVQGIRRFSV